MVDPVVTELVGECEPLAGDPLAAVEENERLLASNEVRAGDALREGENRYRYASGLLDHLQQIVDGLIEAEAQLEARRPGGGDRLTHVRGGRHDSAPERSLEREKVVHDRRELGDRGISLVGP